MSLRFITMLLAGVAFVPATLLAQTVATAPAQAPAASNRAFPAPLTIPGKPIESRPPERALNKPAFPQQTRAPYQKTADYNVTVITDKLMNPWCIAFLSDGKYLVTERENASAVRIVSPDGTISAPLKGLTPLAPPGKLGLLDIALDPKFAVNKRVFFTFFERLADGYSNTFVGRAVLDEAGGALKDVTVIFRALPLAPIKNFSTKQGGRIAFAKDGTMFIVIGDRDRDTPWLKAQEMDNHLGKIVHITQDGLPAPNNPYLGKPGVMPEIWVSGLRSPQGLAFDPRSGKLWEHEHGPRGGDELNLIAKARNYGWPIISYGINYPGEPIGDGIDKKEGLEQPVYYWDPVIAPSGLAFYKGNLFPEWKDSVFIGGLRGQMISRLTLKNDKVVAEEALLTGQKSRIRDVRVGPDGAVYVLAEPNKLLKLTPKK